MLHRRDILKATTSLTLLSIMPKAAFAAAQSGQPVARVVDACDRRFGLTLPDPYRWMENPGDPEWEPFMRGQADYARMQLDAIPTRSAISRRIAELSGNLVQPYSVQHAGDKMFVELRPAGANIYKLYVRDRSDGELRLLYDPAADTDSSGTHRSLDYWAVSPDGQHLAFGSSLAGSEDSVLRVLRTGDGSLLTDTLDRAQYARLSWLPDSSGFFISRLQEGTVRGADDYYQNSTIWLHQLGTHPESDLRIGGGGDAIDGYRIDAAEFPAVITAPNSEWALLQASGAVRRHNPVFAARLDDIRAGRPEWRALVGLEDQVTNIVLTGDDFYFVSERGAPNGQVFRLRLAATRAARAQPVEPETDYPIEPTAHGNLMVAAEEGVYFVRTHGGPQVIYRLTPGDRAEPVSMPFDAGIYELFAHPGKSGANIRMAGWTRPVNIWRTHPETEGLVDIGLGPKVDGLALNRFESFQIQASARDGTQVPVSVVKLRSVPRDSSAPCLARCYSAYGRSAIPSFNIRALAFLERGGVLAQVHARGGGEFGSRWAAAGRKQTKPNTWRDFIDGCEALIANNIVSPKRLTIMGSSAGGIAVGRAMTDRPDLFAGAIFNVAFTNPTRIAASASGPSQYDEFGNPEIQDEYHGLYEMDTYQHVSDGVKYPRTLITHGMNDSRVAPWYSAKLAARLQAVSCNQVLLRVTFDTGHGAGSTRNQVDERWTDTFSFALSASSS